MKRTLQQRLVSYLTTLGFRQVECRSSKYIELFSPKGNHYFIGKLGAFRGGSSASNSHAIPDSTKARIIAQMESWEKGQN